jgi:hypothetical protein
MFFENPAAAFANLHRASRRGGRLVFTCWPPREQTPLLVAPARALLGVVDMPPPAPPGAPSPFSLGDLATTTALLAAAGWQDVAVTELTWEVTLPDDLHDAARTLSETIPATLMLQGLDEPTLAKARQALASAVPANRRMTQLAYLVTATA